MEHYEPKILGPDCADGNVSIEQLVATYTMLWRYNLTGAAIIGKTADYLKGWRDAVDHLRAVKPTE